MAASLRGKIELFHPISIEDKAFRNPPPRLSGISAKFGPIFSGCQLTVCSHCHCHRNSEIRARGICVTKVTLRARMPPHFLLSKNGCRSRELDAMSWKSRKRYLPPAYAGKGATMALSSGGHLFNLPGLLLRCKDTMPILEPGNHRTSCSFSTNKEQRFN